MYTYHHQYEIMKSWNLIELTQLERQKEDNKETLQICPTSKDSEESHQRQRISSGKTHLHIFYICFLLKIIFKTQNRKLFLQLNFDLFVNEYSDVTL